MDNTSELVRCALNVTGRLTFGGDRKRRAVLTHLVRNGLLESVNSAATHNASTSYITIDRGAKLRLTEQGRATVRALNPSDFSNVVFFPLPVDIQRAIERVTPKED